MKLETLEDFDVCYGSRKVSKKDVIWHLYNKTMECQNYEKLLKEQKAKIKELEQKLLEEEGRHAVELLDAEYEGWKKCNSEFMERFVKDILKNSLSIHCGDDYGGYFSVELKLDGNTISYDDRNININR